MSSASVASAPVYVYYRAGYHLATAEIAITLVKDGVATTTTSDVILVLDGGAWRWQTLDATR